MKEILDGLNQYENLTRELTPLQEKIEERLNLTAYTGDNAPFAFNNSADVARFALLVSLSNSASREMEKVNAIEGGRYSIGSNYFNKNGNQALYAALLKMRYHNCKIDWKDKSLIGKIVTYEMLRGRNMLLKDGELDRWLTFVPNNNAAAGTIPNMALKIGKYENNDDATLNINSIGVPNTQILVAGATGSGKTNLLMALLSQIRQQSTDTNYPVNFLLFDYKGEFSDEQNRKWLPLLGVNGHCILNPLQRPLPFNPFKNLEGKTVNEINLYATTLATSLINIFGARPGANMDNNLRTSICEAYEESKGRPITFEAVQQKYLTRCNPNGDTISNSLSQLVYTKLFAENDTVDLIKNSYILNLGSIASNAGSLAKAIVYFTTSKLNDIYETLTPQARNDKYFELRHYTIIDEAHYMLEFNNQPLENLIKVGRNKGMSVILATQDMADFSTKNYNYYQNAYYPIIMKQNQVDEKLIRTIFGASQNETKGIVQAINNLQMGEMLMKNHDHEITGGRRYKKIKVDKVI